MDQTTSNLSYVTRLKSIDLLRGLALILMALDHVRHFFGPTLFIPTDLSHTTAVLFFTRFITHFCASIFIFLTGVSAYLYGMRHSSRELSIFLLTRGIWLILLEATVVTIIWRFNFNALVILQVIFALGSSLIILAGLIWLPLSIILLVSIVTIFCHNTLDTFTFSDLFLKNIWAFLHAPTTIHLGSWSIEIVYPIIPWFGIMSLGYYLGSWFEKTAAVRSKRFFYLGIFCGGLFCILRYFNIYGDSNLWVVQPNNTIFSILSFLNVTKYPASLLYTLITLGIAFILLALMEKWQSKSNHIVLCFGKVSLFFYLIHLYLIHILAVIYWHIVLGVEAGWWVTTDHPWPASYHLNLELVYGIWILLIIILYPLCRSYQKYKSTHNYKWLSYL